MYFMVYRETQFGPDRYGAWETRDEAEREASKLRKQTGRKVWIEASEEL